VYLQGNFTRNVKNATNIVDNKKVQKKLDSLAYGVTSSTVHLPAKKSKET
jgi:hypothetical protein